MPVFFLRRLARSRAIEHLLVLFIAGSTLAARADGFGLKLDPGVAFPLTEQQSQRFETGGAAAAKLLYGLGPNFDVTLNASFIGLPRAAGSLSDGPGTAWGYGPGLRFKGSHDSDAIFGVSPWVDGDALYVRTGGVNRPGVAVALGLAFPIGVSRQLWFGPYARYEQIIGTGGSGTDSRDAKVFIAGLSFEIGMGRPEPVYTSPAPICAAPVECPVIARLPDRDGDGVPDKFDRCPDVAGPIDNQGCPLYKKIVVHDEKLELKEKIAFERDSDQLDAVSFPVLDEVAQALRENKSFKVSIEGYASSEGTDEHNQSLSERRANAVLDYLARHGIARDRLSSRGFGDHRPLYSNDTHEGREGNRRVEFVVSFVILNKEGSVQ